MNPTLEAKLSNLPDKPGIYQFFNEKKKVIYVGKAKNLKNRVRSYFHSNITSPKTIALVSKICDLEMIITGNEIEALVLENNLIKELKPRYNINLKDDKTYPFIKITNEPFPRIFPTRKVIRDGSKYFGPYTDVKNMKSSLRMINQIFRIRSCSLALTDENIEKKKFKVCLDFHIKKCDGPCEGLFSKEEYAEMVDEVERLLKGKTDDLIAVLNEKMNLHVANLEFEKAAVVRDKLNQLSAISSKQKVVSTDNADRDIIAAAKEDKDVSGSILIIRNGKLVAKKQIRLSVEMDDEMPEIYTAIIKFFYGDFVEIPSEIVLEMLPADEETLKEWLASKAGKKVKFTVPKKESDVKSLTKMCKENAILQLKDLQLQRMKKEGNVPYVLSALKRDLRLNVLPRTIECFDNSNLQGTDPVASMVVFVDGKPKKNLYRKFIIKEVVGPDDFASMREIIRRRYSRVIEEKLPFPELIMVDGGKGQLSSAVEVLEELGVKNYNIIGLAKRLEEVFFPNNSEAESIPKTSSGLKLLQQVRDEAHRFAITFHRERRSKRIITSELNEIKGIGDNTIETLLKELGSVENIKNSPIEKIEEIIGKKKASIVKNYFENKKNETDNLVILFILISLTSLNARDNDRKISPFPFDNYRALLNYSTVRDTLYTLGDSYIEVNLKTQSAHLFQRNGDVKFFKISSGNPKLPKGVETKEGLYVIQCKLPQWHSRQFDSTLMINWMGFNYGVGFHALAGKSYYKYLGNKPSSHGCVRVSREDAADVYEKIKLGTPVLVHRGNTAVAIQFADTLTRYSLLNKKNLATKHKQRLKDLYDGKYMLYYDEKFLLDYQNVSHDGLDIGDTERIPEKPIYYPYFIDLARAQEELLNPNRKKVFKMFETQKLATPNLLTLEK